MRRDANRADRVLVAYDGSASSRRALLHAAELTRGGDVVTVVNVMPTPGVGAGIAPPSEERNRQWQLLDDARRLLAGRALELRTVATVGDVVTEILTAAKDAGADVIVVGRGRGRMPHARGSISGRIVRSADADVLVVHEDGTLLALDAPAEGG